MAVTAVSQRLRLVRFAWQPPPRRATAHAPGNHVGLRRLRGHRHGGAHPAARAPHGQRARQAGAAAALALLQGHEAGRDGRAQVHQEAQQRARQATRGGARRRARGKKESAHARAAHRSGARGGRAAGASRHPRLRDAARGREQRGLCKGKVPQVAPAAQAAQVRGRRGRVGARRAGTTSRARARDGQKARASPAAVVRRRQGARRERRRAGDVRRVHPRVQREGGHGVARPRR